MIKRLLSSRLDEWVSPDVAVCLLRVGVSLLMMTHGWPKLLNVLAGDFSFGDPIGIGEAPSLILVAFAEFVCSVFILLGLWTRIAIFPLITTMLVAAFVAHAGDPFSDKELSLFFLLSYVTLFLSGPGKYSLDQKLWGK
jgi:putative oxidoreductase